MYPSNCSKLTDNKGKYFKCYFVLTSLYCPQFIPDLVLYHQRSDFNIQSCRPLAFHLIKIKKLLLERKEILFVSSLIHPNQNSSAMNVR